MRFTTYPILLALLALVPVSSAWGQDKPYLDVFGETTRPVEGDADNVVLIRWQFSRPPSFEVRFTVRTDETQSPSATPGVDYEVMAPTEVVVPAGQQSGTTPVTIKGDTIVDPNEMFFMKFYNFRGGGTAIDTGTGENNVGILIIDDDIPPQPPLIGNDDHVSFVIDEGVTFFPGENDAHDEWNVLRDTVLTVLEAPASGTLTQMDYGSGIDYFNYHPNPDFAGLDQFRYRLCTSDGTECVEATVHLRGQLRTPVNFGSSGRSAGFPVDLATHPPVAEARFAVSTLAHPRREVFQTDVDPTPHLAWDSREGTAWTTGILPASPAGESIDRRVFSRLLTSSDEAVDLRIGLDLDGDGQPSPGEVACLSVGVYGVVPECLLTVDVGAAPVTYWVSVHSREETPYTQAVNIFELRMDDPDSLLRATGPVTVVRDGGLDMMVSWTDPRAMGPLEAFVAVMDGDTRIGEFRLDLHGGEGTVLLPVDGSPVWVDLYPSSMKWWEERGLYFDVPPGAEAITLTMGADVPITFAPHWFGFEERYVSYVRDSGSSEPDSSYVPVAAGQMRTITVRSPQQGRWYALVRNGADARARVKVQVEVQATMPAIRPGSYYNPAQAGHGLLLYPAGDQWAGLWYTYDRFGRPTWYYLQATRPGTDGVWRAPVLRSAWNGKASTLTEIGVMQITPQDDQRFFMSYMVDGYAGSQVMAALGTGCPMKDGAPLDISSHWFDPARAGNGYSVQTWQDGYQFIAAFTYDSRGNPLFLAAERADLGGDVADLELEVLRGTCPTICDYRAPTRTSAGILRRILASSSLAEISLDVDYSAPWVYGGRETFSSTDRVQLLGGPGTTQGCNP